MDPTGAAMPLAAIALTTGGIIVLLALSALFSGSETALTTASRGKLHAMAERGDSAASAAMNITEDKERLIGAILLGNNLVNILAASLATSLFTVLFGESGVALATLVMTALVLIFSEVMPKTYAITNAERLATRVARLMSLIVMLFSPIVGAVRAFVRLLLRALGVETDPKANVLAAHEEIAGTIALHHSEAGLERAERDRLLGALDLGQRQVEEIMLHRRDIETLDCGSPTEEMLTQALSSPHTRLPIYRGNPENIVGIIHAKDLSRAVAKLLNEVPGGMEALGSLDILSIAMEPYFIPNTTPLDDQLREFIRRRGHFALVVDEYGALQGLVTLEDILEEIVGEITDEHDVEEPGGIDLQEDGSVEVEGSVTIRDLNRACEWQLPDEEANTIAGLVIHEAQTIPTEGQVFSFHGFRFEVLEREENRLTRLRVLRIE
jgi:Mg2+/Co2+ transporter CorB